MRDYRYDHVHLRSPDPNATAQFFETMFGAEVTRSVYARRAIIAVVGARLDTKLNLHLFSRLLRLPLDYFRTHTLPLRPRAREGTSSASLSSTKRR